MKSLKTFLLKFIDYSNQSKVFKTFNVLLQKYLEYCVVINEHTNKAIYKAASLIDWFNN